MTVQKSSVAFAYWDIWLLLLKMWRALDGKALSYIPPNPAPRPVDITGRDPT